MRGTAAPIDCPLIGCDCKKNPPSDRIISKFGKYIIFLFRDVKGPCARAAPRIFPFVPVDIAEVVILISSAKS